MKHYNLSVTDAAREWRRSVEECEKVLTHLHDVPVFPLKYETLCAEPDRTLDEIFDFIGVEPGQADKDFRNADHHIIGNSMRLQSSGEIRLDEKWRKTLSEGDLTVFGTEAGTLNQKLGYGSELDLSVPDLPAKQSGAGH